MLISIILLTGCDILKKEEVPDGYEKVKTIEYGQIDADRIAYRNMLITNYAKYQEIINHYNVESKLKEEDFEKNNYIVLIGEDRYCDGKIDSFKGIKIEKDTINVKFRIEKTCKECSIKFYLYLIEVEKEKVPVEKDVKYYYEPIKDIYCDKENKNGKEK